MKMPHVTWACTRRLILAASIACIALIAGADIAVNTYAEPRMYTELDDVPVHKTAMVLGTSKYMPDGRDNLFYKYRIEAVLRLLEAGRVEYVLISGDNATASYSEPDAMRDDLVEAGVEQDRIYLDYAGFRTWDSVVRANEVFLQDELVIVSQPFHVARALYIAKAHGMDAVGYTAQDVPVARSPRVWIRERLARVKLLMDVLVRAQPKFLGETIEIGVDEPV